MTGHMTPEEFRRQGHAAIDWIADYWASLDALPVLSQVGPGDVRRMLPAEPPEEAELRAGSAARVFAAGRRFSWWTATG